MDDLVEIINFMLTGDATGLNLMGKGADPTAHPFFGEFMQFCEEIKARMADRVTDGENYAYVEFKGGTHAYNCWLPHLYNCLLVFFK